MSTQKLDLRHINHVFVYGTLKSGFGNNPLMGNSRLIGEGLTEGEYQLFDLGCPIAVPSAMSPTSATIMPIRGEVWSVSDPEVFRRLDILEGHPRSYYRTIEKVNGELVWMYSYPHQIQFEQNLCQIIEGAYQWGI